MKFRTRKPFKQAESFLADICKGNQAEFARIVDLIGAFKYGEADKGEVFDYIVSVVKKSPLLLSKFNSFLNPDRQITLISNQKIQKLLVHLLDEMHKIVKTGPSFDSFIRFFEQISNKMDEECIKFVSYDEILKFFVDEMTANELIKESGPELRSTAQQILNDYVAAVRANPVLDEPEPLEELPPTPEQRPVSPEKVPKREAEASKSQKLTRSGDWNSGRLKNRKAVVRTPVAPEPVGQAVELEETVPAPLTVPETESSDERKTEGMKGEFSVFKAIRRKIGETAFNSLAKSLVLYKMNVVSYFELVKLIEQLLIGKSIDKKLLLSLREVLETRDQKRTVDCVFNVKLCNEEIGGQTVNLSYNRVVWPFSKTASSDSLINKEYVAIATGNEAGPATNDDVPLRNVGKNSAEEVLFRNEDEIHEFDSNIIQLRVCLSLLTRIQREKLGTEALTAICGRLRTVRALGLIYGNKAVKIVEKLKQRPKELIELVVERLNEKLKLLEDAKKEFERKSWAPRLLENFYKSLDARSYSQKAFERVSVGMKQVLQSLRNAQKERREAGHSEGSYLSNPLLTFGFPNKSISKDVLHLLGVYLKQSKTNFDKRKCLFFVKKLILSFLQLSESDSFVELRLESSEDLQRELAAIEVQVSPNKAFYYHQKLTVRFEKENNKAFNEAVHKELSFSELFPSESPFTTVPSVETTAVEPETMPEQVHVGFDPNFDNRLSFFGGPAIFAVFKYFHLLYERFELASRFSIVHFGDDRVYQLFYSLVLYHILGEMDYGNFENAVLTIFDQQSGFLLNIDRLLQHFFKAVPNDELHAFIVKLNPSVFGTSTDVLPVSEGVLLAKTCQKMQEVAVRESKGQKNQYSGSASVDGSLDLLKFQFVPESQSLVVHSFDGLFRVEGREMVPTKQSLLDVCCDFMSLPATKSAEHRKNNKRLKQRHLFSCRRFNFNVQKRKLVPIGSETEEWLFSVASEQSCERRTKKVVKARKLSVLDSLRQRHLRPVIE